MYQFQKLDIWVESLVVVKDIYSLSKNLPKEERYSLSSQIQRAAVSVSLNIAEGKGSGYDKEFSRFLNMSLRSLHETAAALIIATELGYLSDSDISDVCMYMEKLGGKIRALINRLNSQKPKASSQ